jgi:Meiotic cell cortex C-terminal pleckstrin homology
VTIQSVLDVKDDNPSPKGMTPLFNRSILILTPARALKFTATTRERHYVWLTALSFLAHSSQAVPDIMAVSSPPAVPDFELPRPPARLRKHPGIRDSIRVAKGKGYGSAATRSGPTSVHSSQQGGELSICTDTSTRGEHPQSAKELNRFFTPEAADPPVVPRFTDRTYPSGHGRKRSNTGSRVPPPLSFRGFSERGPLPPVTSSFSTSGGGSNASHPYSNGNGHGGMNGGSGGHNHAPSTAGISVGTNGSSDIYQSQHSGSVAGYGMSVSGRSSVRTSDASARPSAVVGNFFDAVGTMRMEAFISPIGMNRFDDFPDEMDEAGMVGFGKRHSREMLPRRSRESRRRSRHRDSFYSGRGGKDDWYGGSRTAGEEEYGLSFSRERDDPFRGF